MEIHTLVEFILQKKKQRLWLKVVDSIMLLQLKLNGRNRYDNRRKND